MMRGCRKCIREHVLRFDTRLSWYALLWPYCNCIEHFWMRNNHLMSAVTNLEVEFLASVTEWIMVVWLFQRESRNKVSVLLFHIEQKIIFLLHKLYRIGSNFPIVLYCRRTAPQGAPDGVKATWQVKSSQFILSDRRCLDIRTWHRPPCLSFSINLCAFGSLPFVYASRSLSLPKTPLGRGGSMTPSETNLLPILFKFLLHFSTRPSTVLSIPSEWLPQLTPSSARNGAGCQYTKNGHRSINLWQAILAPPAG